ncbi:MAG TPA: hypothetical protein VFG05_09450 [Methylocella sp.]|nr:hypothetical protein [Methylocella sp.]
MEILLTGGALGALLGRFFKVLILVPVTGLAAGLLLMECEFAGSTFAESLFGVALLIASLEAGYLTGVLSTDIPLALKAVGGSRCQAAQPAPEEINAA